MNEHCLDNFHLIDMYLYTLFIYLFISSFHFLNIRLAVVAEILENKTLVAF